jgi:arylsulfatase
VRLYSAGFKTGKGTPYEGGTHVPAFWRWKGVLAEGVDIAALTAHIDLFKTFCELAGAQIPDEIQEIDGRSLLPLLEDPQADWPDRQLFVHVGRWEKGVEPDKHKFDNCAVRTQRWRFVNNIELYDIADDPYESTSVAAEHPDVVQTLRDSFEAWWAETRPLMVNEDAPYAPQQPQAVRYETQLRQRGIPDWVPPKL